MLSWSAIGGANRTLRFLSTWADARWRGPSRLSHSTLLEISAIAIHSLVDYFHSDRETASYDRYETLAPYEFSVLRERSSLPRDVADAESARWRLRYTETDGEKKNLLQYPRHTCIEQNIYSVNKWSVPQIHCADWSGGKKYRGNGIKNTIKLTEMKE